MSSSAGLTAARIAWDAQGVPCAPDFGDRYHPREGSAAQARHVFLHGNGLPRRWQQRTGFTILETGFGLGLNFLATWQAWRDDPDRCGHLHYVAIEGHPPREHDLKRAHDASPWPRLGQALRKVWPAAVAGWYPIDLEDGRVQLLLALGDAAVVARQLDLQADALYLDGFAPDRNPAMWSPVLFKALARRLAPGATVATWSVARSVRDALAGAGLEVSCAPGVGAKRETLRGHYLPRSGVAAPRREAVGLRSVAVVGAGLAGAWTAWTLARLGWHATVFDAMPAPALQASGNAVGLMHATVHADDGPHARLARAAAWIAARSVAPWVESGEIAGRLGGLVRLARPGQRAQQLRAVLARHGLPPETADVLDIEAACERSGLPLAVPGWWFTDAGWLAPAALVRRLLQGIDFVGGCAVAALVPAHNGWRLHDARGEVMAEAGAVVLANAADAARLWPAGGWPLARSRGQLSGWCPAPVDAPALPWPVSGDGYALRASDGSLWCGATSHADDEDPTLRDADHDFNCARLARLVGWQAPVPDAGRVAWRVQVPDRLPVAGAVAGHIPAQAARATDCRRTAGLFVLTALGSRGITWAPLMARIVAAWAGATPMPVPARLRDAVDPARWQLRAARRQARSSPSV